MLGQGEDCKPESTDSAIIVALDSRRERKVLPRQKPRAAAKLAGFEIGSLEKRAPPYAQISRLAVQDLGIVQAHFLGANEVCIFQSYSVFKFTKERRFGGGVSRDNGNALSPGTQTAFRPLSVTDLLLPGLVRGCARDLKHLPVP